ncbi:MAG TPA: archease [Polyangiaceae bacterium]|nr:archease [Polyangiaceae bacterium]
MTHPAGARHRFVEHTGELELRLEAPTLAALLEEGARALAEVMAEDASGPPTEPPERVEVAASDRESLLVSWLNELVYRGEVSKCVYRDVHVERADDRRVEATLRGRTPASPRTAVKAATWHRLRVRETSTGLEATVVLDV